MAKIILKCPYLKPGAKEHSRNLIEYIATRDGVDKIDDTWKQKPVTLRQKVFILDLLKDFPDSKDSYEYQDYLQEPTIANASEFISRTMEDHYDQAASRDNYVRYIANRPGVEKMGAHGLFTDSNVPIDLQKAAEEVANHKGRIWTNILSLRREDAERLGYEDGRVWRDLIRGQAGQIAESMKIPLEDLRWYGAFHNESHHPRVHLVVYSAGKEPYLSKQGIQSMKSAFAREIFKADLIHIYSEQTHCRDSLNQEVRSRLQQIVDAVHQGSYDNPEVSQMFQQLAGQLRQAKGKKVYGYLPQESRDLVNRVIDELAKDTRLAELYGLWYAQRDAFISTYQDTMEERLPLSQNKTFHSVRNIVVSEVLNLSDTPAVADLKEQVPEEVVEKDVLAVWEETHSSESENASEALPTDNEPMDEAVPEDSEQEAPASEERLEGTPEFTPPYEYQSFTPGKKNSWWNEDYKLARRYLYGTKEEPPDLSLAHQLMTAQAESGNGLAMHDLGKMYLSGFGCEKDEELAHSWFRKAHSAFSRMEAAAKKPAYWQYRIGKLYAYGYGVDQDYEQSARWFTKAVDGGSPFAAYALGGQYYRGQGVEQDHREAYRLFHIAATDTDKPNAYAQYQLGRMCRDGIGTEVDKDASNQWYQQAYLGFLSMEQDMADDKLYYRLGSMNLTGTGTEVDLEKARDYLEKAAKLENTDALYGLGKLHLQKDYDGYNPDLAARYLEEAAQHDHAYAQYKLGKLLLSGDGVMPEPKRAEALLTRSMEQGNLYAAYTLGKAYLSGEQLPLNVSKAVHLLTAAAELDMDAAQYALAKLYLGDTLMPKDVEKALHWLRKAVEKENQFAQYQLGKMLLYGQDIPQDIEAGKALLQASANQGNLYAQRILATYGQMPVHRAAFRLLTSMAQIIRNDIENEQSLRGKFRIDRKQFLKIAEKKQAQGLRIG